MRILIILLCLFMSSPARAMGMCMPTYTDTTGIYRKNLNDGRGLFYQGGGTGHPIYTYGESWCSAAARRPADNFDTFGMYCWCRFTRHINVNGYTVPFAGDWVFRIKWNSEADCITYCAGYCSDTIRGGPERRRIMLISR